MRALLAGLLALIGQAAPGWSQECRPARTALVLSGGGVKGLAHVGVLEVLDRLGARPDLIVGTSMGAIIGALYAAGYSARQIDSLARGLPIAEIVRPFRVPAPHPWDDRLPLLFMVRGRRGFEFQTGIVDETQPNARLNAAMLTGNLLARGRFDRLPIPFRAVATDLRDRSAVVQAEGDLARAVRASSAIPLVFPPVVADGAVLVDGGLAANIPVAEARAAGAERVIVVDVTEHPRDTLDAESPVALADQLLGFLFQQPAAELRPDDLLIRPAVQGYRSLDFSQRTVAEILRLGREAADSVLAGARCLPRGGPRPEPAPPPVVAGWTIPPGGMIDSAEVGAMLGLEPGATLDVERLRGRLLRLGDTEGLRGLWLNPVGSDDTVRFRLEPIRAPRTVGGAGLAYDHELGGQAWVGIFDRGLFGSPLEGAMIGTLGRFQRELYAAALWHGDAAWAGVTPLATIRVRTENVRRFTAEGDELPELGTSDVRATAGLEFRPGGGWRLRFAADLITFGNDTARGRTTGGGSVRVDRIGRRGPDLFGEAVLTGAWQSARLAVSWPFGSGRWRLVPTGRLGWGGADLPAQWTHPLGGDDGFPGLHLGEPRGARELSAAIRAGYSVFGPVEARVRLAAGRAWTPGPAAADWVFGARVGLGADTPAGPLEAGYGATTSGRTAVYIRVGKWF